MSTRALTPMTTTTNLSTIRLTEELDAANDALTALDADRLEVTEQRIRSITAAHLAASREQLPELLEKHTLLGRLLDATAANLKVLVSVLNLDAMRETR